MAKCMKRLFITVLAVLMLLNNGNQVAAISVKEQPNSSSNVTELSVTQINTSNIDVKQEYGSILKDNLSSQYSEDDIVRVSIFLNDDSIVEKGFSTRKIAANNRAMQYRTELLNKHEVIKEKISGIASSFDVKSDFVLLVNAISAEIKYSDLNKIRAIDGVKAVELESYYTVPDIGALNDSQETGTISQSISVRDSIGTPLLWAEGYTGAGSRIAIIDTGINDLHESFFGEPLIYSLQQSGVYGSVDLMDENDLQSYIDSGLLHSTQYQSEDALKVPKYINSKIPYSYNYAAGSQNTYDELYLSYHGTHVASIAAGNRYYFERLDCGKILDATQVVDKTVGVAPDAQIIVMKVFDMLANGGSPSDGVIMMAVEDALYLDCDSINLSLGRIFGQSHSIYDDVWRNLDKINDCVINVAIGNDYSFTEYYGLDHDLYIEDVRIGTAANPATYIYPLSVASSGLKDGIRNKDEIAPYYASYLSECFDISQFSSWGVPSSLLLKPEISAPGEDIWAADGLSYDRYIAHSGTSMATPHVSGIAALVKEYLIKNGITIEGYSTRALTQSLLMSTANPLKDGENYYPVLQQGSGLIDGASAILSKTIILMNDNDDSLTAITGAAADGKVKIELGDDPNKEGKYSYKFRIYNISSDRVYFDTPSTDIFTQDYYMQDGVLYLSKSTKEVGNQLSYTWDINGVVNNVYDITADGVTNNLDLEALLQYLVGTRNENELNLRVADIDNDGIISSFDAHLLAQYLENNTYVPENGYADVTITFSFDVDNSIYCNGAYIEGFTFIREKEGVTHSIPILGFYGSWAEPSMYNSSYTEILYGETRQYHDEFGIPTLYTYSSGKYYPFSGNPYTVENTFPDGKLAFNSDNMFLWIDGGFLAPFTFDGEVLEKVEDGENEVLFVDAEAGDFFDAWGIVVSPFDWNDFELEEGAKYRFRLCSIPEYYKIRYCSSVNKYDEYDPFIDSGTLYNFIEFVDENYAQQNSGVYFGYEFYIDNTSPVLSNVILDKENNMLSVDAADNLNIAYLALLSPDGKTVYNYIVPGCSEYHWNIDISESIENTEGYYVLFAGDYAKNETGIIINCNSNTFEKHLDTIISYEGNRYFGSFNTSDIDSLSIVDCEEDDRNENIDFVFTQLNSEGVVTNYAITNKDNLYVINDDYTMTKECEIENYFIDAAPGSYELQERYNAFAAINDFEIIISDTNSGAELSVFNLVPYIQADIYSIAAKDIRRFVSMTRWYYQYDCEYYILDENGIIWDVVLDFFDFPLAGVDLVNNTKLIDVRKVCDTGLPILYDSPMYYDGKNLFLAVNNGISSDLYIVYPELGIYQKLCTMPEGMVIESIYEKDVIPTINNSSNELSYNLLKNNIIEGRPNLDTHEKTNEFNEKGFVISPAEIVYPENEFNDVNVNIVYDEKVTNGYVTITYSADKALFIGLDTDLKYNAISVDEDNGIIKFVYANAEEIDANKILASMHFQSKQCRESVINVNTNERNNNLELDETVSTHLEANHKWEFMRIIWSKFGSTYKAYAYYKCEKCGIHSAIIEVPIVKIESNGTLSKTYTATISATDSLDGEEHTSTYTVCIKPIVINDKKISKIDQVNINKSTILPTAAELTTKLSGLTAKL